MYEQVEVGTKIRWGSNGRGGALVEFWETTSGRWFWHRRHGSDVTESGSYSSRRALRRFLNKRFGPQEG